MSTERVLVVDDEPSVRFTISEVLASAGFAVDEAPDVDSAIAKAPAADVIITDLSMPQKSGMDLLAWTREHCAETPVIILTARGSERAAVLAMKGGAWDYLSKPFDNMELVLSVRRAMERVALLASDKRRVAQNILGHWIIGESPVFLSLLKTARRVAERDVTVLLQGESGTGKEAIAALIHAHSKHHQGPLIRFNCAAVTASLAQTELFGHEAGAFTGATRGHDGFFRRADGGTLVLDEVAELPLSVQSTLLRALQQGEVQSVGAKRAQRVKVRIIACTHAELEERVSSGQFRQDLYYRLNVVTLRVPSLAERRDDIPRLARHFQLKYAQQFGLSDIPLPQAVMHHLMQRSWPGNVRELENCVAQLLALSQDGQLTRSALDTLGDAQQTSTPRAAASPADAPESTAPSDRAPLRERVSAFERELIATALRQCGGNQSEAARQLGTTRTTLIDKIKRLGLTSKT